jgi:hypothetical protein
VISFTIIAITLVAGIITGAIAPVGSDIANKVNGRFRACRYSVRPAAAPYRGIGPQGFTPQRGCSIRKGSQVTSSAAERGRVGAHVSWANTSDRPARTRSARRAFMARFEREVDPDGLLSPSERAARADHALRAHMARMRLARAAKARRATRQGR